MRDLVFETDVHQLMASTNLTASKTNMTVLDLQAAGIESALYGAVYFLIGVDAISTADASNYFTIKLFHSDAKTSATALTSGVEVTSTTGLLNSAAPTIAATTLTTQAQKCIIVGYRGIKRYLQIQPTETGTADVTISVYAVLGHGDSTHGSKIS